MRIIQLLPTLSFGDAVGNDALAIRDILVAQGYETGIYAQNIDSRLPKGTVRKVEEMPQLQAEDILLYHGSTGTQLNYDLPQFGGKHIMIYHNITPPSFFERYSAHSAALTKEGYDGMRYLADKLAFCIAVSEYNKNELRRLGYTCPIEVCPILIPFEDYAKAPNRDILNKYSKDGWTNLLFVGRIAPNKRQEDVIRAFYCYQRRYNAKSHLFLVGSSLGMEPYAKDLQDYSRLLGIADKVIFPGHIGFDEILAYYCLADVFVCMSEHEGFCVPLVEAMLFDVPIVAYASTAIPETLGKGGLLLDEKDPELVAATINRVLQDEALRCHLVAKQQIRLQSFQYDVVAHRFMDCLHTLLESRG